MRKIPFIGERARSNRNTTKHITCPEDGHCIRTNLYNEWSTDMKNERIRARILMRWSDLDIDSIPAVDVHVASLKLFEVCLK